MATPKTKFTEVLTTPDLVPSSSQTADTFPTVITESSLLESTPSKSSFSNVSVVISDSPADLIRAYDSTFENPQHYHDFAHRKLAPWKHMLEFKHFHTSYLHHRATTRSITELRKQAQALLEEATILQNHHDTQMVEFRRFIPTITRRDFKHQLSRPSKVYPQQPNSLPVPILRRSPQPPRLRMSDRNVAFRTSPTNPRTLNTRSTRPYTCFQCGSTEHIKWYCPQYRCPHCYQISPGHNISNCPDNQPHPNDVYDGTRGYFDIEGENDANYPE